MKKLNKKKLIAEQTKKLHDKYKKPKKEIPKKKKKFKKVSYEVKAKKVYTKPKKELNELSLEQIFSLVKKRKNPFQLYFKVKTKHDFFIISKLFVSDKMSKKYVEQKIKEMLKYVLKPKKQYHEKSLKIHSVYVKAI